jgi:hypothetical protein
MIPIGGRNTYYDGSYRTKQMCPDSYLAKHVVMLMSGKQLDKPKNRGPSHHLIQILLVTT